MFCLKVCPCLVCLYRTASDADIIYNECKKVACFIIEIRHFITISFAAILPQHTSESSQTSSETASSRGR